MHRVFAAGIIFLFASHPAVSRDLGVVSLGPKPTETCVADGGLSAGPDQIVAAGRAPGKPGVTIRHHRTSQHNVTTRLPGAVRSTSGDQTSPVATLSTSGGMSKGRVYLGYGRLVVNDDFADLNDRWRTGSVSTSRIWGPEWTGTLPTRAGEILELRIKGEIIAPSNLSGPTAGDRPYATSIGVGGHTHFALSGWDIGAGVDLVMVGPQTGLAGLQASLHEMWNFAGPSPAVLAGQIGNGFHVRGSVTAGRDFTFSGGRIRPFAEARIGVETLARIGADVTFGPAGQGELLIRDEVTGHRYRVVEQAEPGISLMVGGDVAYVDDSVYLPRSSGQLVQTRTRLRGGVHWQTEKWRGFYGLSWHSKEFKTQPEGQILGALRLDFQF